ncbi:LCP family protein [Synechococcus sp. ATX 2A4]|uniref:LCP family protein n=1 Tax=Synechococcus sp. ATX 2A4 TaxID=2823727 RepID=UPI0020CB9C6F|nr:LCP family protein [Synechococcus sp. ATX 2A4]
MAGGSKSRRRGAAPAASGAAGPPADPAQAQAGGRPRARWGSRLWKLSLALLAAVGTAVLFERVWSRPDPGLVSSDQAGLNKDLADPPIRPITVLLIGTDADRLDASTNSAAPRGPANADTLLLIRADPDGAMRVLNVPTELAVQVPGQQKLQTLGALYRLGGPALTADGVGELVGLDPGQPERYVVMPRQVLRTLVDGLGGLEVNLDQAIRYQDKTQNYRIELQGGLQVLKGPQVEQLVRFKGSDDGLSGRRSRQQKVIGGLLEQLGRPGGTAKLAQQVRQLQPLVGTNLTETEILSLLNVAIQQAHTVRYDKLPLAPTTEPGQTLRQVAPGAEQPLWPAG